MSGPNTGTESVRVSSSFTTKELRSVDTHFQSILPTGGLKAEAGKIFHEVTVIVHRAYSGREVGIYTDWIPMSEKDVAEFTKVLCSGFTQ